MLATWNCSFNEHYNKGSSMSKAEASDSWILTLSFLNFYNYLLHKSHVIFQVPDIYHMVHSQYT